MTLVTTSQASRTHPWVAAARVTDVPAGAAGQLMARPADARRGANTKTTPANFRQPISRPCGGEHVGDHGERTCGSVASALPNRAAGSNSRANPGGRPSICGFAPTAGLSVAGWTHCNRNFRELARVACGFEQESR